jgi:hypothetical protein
MNLFMFSHYNTWWDAIEAEVQEAGLSEEEAMDRWATLAAKDLLKKHKLRLDEGTLLNDTSLVCKAWILEHLAEEF